MFDLVFSLFPALQSSLDMQIGRAMAHLFTGGLRDMAL